MNKLARLLEVIDTLRLAERSIKFEPRDIWIGVFWNLSTTVMTGRLLVYICILPMLPIKLAFTYLSERGYQKYG